MALSLWLGRGKKLQYCCNDGREKEVLSCCHGKETTERERERVRESLAKQAAAGLS
jgi:hypothetical protein